MPYVPAKNLTLTFASVTQKATDASIDYSIGEVDVTNTTSSGFHEFITDIIQGTLNFTVVVDSASVPTYKAGTSGTASFAMSGGRTTSGTVTILSVRENGGPRGAYQLQCSSKFSGTITGPA
jgi:hypothetical protein